MSHFLVGVVVPGDTSDIEGKVAELLSPYDENLEVTEYERECYCIRSNASKAADKIISEKYGSLQSFKDAFTEHCEKLGIQHREGLSDDERWELSHKRDEEWRKFASPWTKEWEVVRQELRKDTKPTPDCSDCNGTGLYATTYNPKSKWDWYSLGGRWNGAIRNSRRSDETGFNFDMEYRRLGENMTTVEEFLSDPDDRIPYALLTPDGEWHQKGEMGYWGMDSCRVEEGEWPDAVKVLLERHRDCIIVGVDCHI